MGSPDLQNIAQMKIEDLLANVTLTGQGRSTYNRSYLLAAQVRATQKLTHAIEEASNQSNRTAMKMTVLTLVIGTAGILQVLAIAWPYFSYWMGWKIAPIW